MKRLIALFFSAVMVLGLALPALAVAVAEPPAEKALPQKLVIASAPDTVYSDTRLACTHTWVIKAHGAHKTEGMLENGYPYKGPAWFTYYECPNCGATDVTGYTYR